MRNAIRALSICVLVTMGLSAQIGFGQNSDATGRNTCTPWTVKDTNSTCLLSGGEGYFYTRNCADTSRICRWRRYSDCEKTTLCTADDPNVIAECGPWRKVNGVHCIVPGTSHTEQKWTRSCVIGGMQEDLCSDAGPQ